MTRMHPGTCTQGATRDWPALRKWTDGYLGKAFRGKPVIVSNAPTTWDEYKRYLQEASINSLTPQ